MTRFALLFSALCIVAAVVRPVSAQAERKSIEIQKQFANIYEYLDPKSTIIKQARKGESYELVYAGTSWYQVRVRDRVGWLERRAGEIIDTPPARILGVPVAVFSVFIALLVLTLFGVALVVYRQMNAES
jgi:hypothetical protein